MRSPFFALCAVPAMIALASPASAQSGFVFPSCLASLPSGPGGQLQRLIPSEANAPLARQVRGVVARAVTWRPGQTVKVCFKSGTRGAHERVIRVAREWMQFANIVFDFHENGVPRQCKGGEDIKI
ncbi:MAG: hypothetical protein HC869_14645 [Rhodospirillales bacterium]|nr:hypothetical protein [Rhodospirillales bacterium]